MPKFYNRTKGPLAIELSGGVSTLVGPKGILLLPIGEPFSSNLAETVRRGFLVSLPEDDAVEIQAAPAEAGPGLEPALVEEPAAATRLEVAVELSEPETSAEAYTSDLDMPSDSSTDLATEEISAIDTPQRRRKRGS